MPSPKGEGQTDLPINRLNQGEVPLQISIKRFMSNLPFIVANLSQTKLFYKA